MSEGSWLLDEVSDEFFDDFVTGLDFPLEDLEKNVEEEDWNTQFQRLDEPCFDAFAMPEPELCGKNTDDIALATKRRTLPAPYNNISKRKQIQDATIIHSGITTIQHKYDTNDVKDVQMLQTYSPVSVFESSSSCSVENPTFDSIIPQRTRSKRQRLSNCSRIFSVPFISSLPFSGDSNKIPASGLAVETYSSKLTNPVKKKRKKEMSLLSGNMEVRKHVSNDLAVLRKCMHCEVTKTPQWREGPMGPKTLCNACGVRYRSGRLFPEYRPSASPTFVASLHSNCHKKVIEMRSKARRKDGTGS